MQSAIKTHDQVCRDIIDLIDSQKDSLIQLRRELHQHPELAGTEFQTTARLVQYLRQHNVHVAAGERQRGFVVEIEDADSKATSPRVAIRGDMDAVGVQDCKSVDYRSRNAGATHACGHDVHSSALCGAVIALHELAGRGRLPPGFRLRAIFQPAEENATGALEMIERGVLDEVAAIFAVHVDPSRRVGEVGLRSGINSAICDEIHVRVEGRGGHAARPFETHDPLAAAAQFITTVYSLVPRGRQPRGARPDVCCDSWWRGAQRHSRRCHDSRHNAQPGPNGADRAMAKLQAIAAAIGAATETDIQLSIPMHVPGVVCDQSLVEIAWMACEQIVGPDSVQTIPKPSMGGEDFANYSQRVPGAMARVGCTISPDTAMPLHSSHFDVDETVIGVAAKVLALCPIEWHTSQRGRYATHGLPQ